MMINVCDISIQLAFCCLWEHVERAYYVTKEDDLKGSQHDNISCLVLKDKDGRLKILDDPSSNKINSSNLLNLCGDFEWFSSFLLFHTIFFLQFVPCQKQFYTRNGEYPHKSVTYWNLCHSHNVLICLLYVM